MTGPFNCEDNMRAGWRNGTDCRKLRDGSQSGNIEESEEW